MMKNAPMDVLKFKCAKIYFGALSFENIYTIITFINIKKSNRDKWNEDEIAPEIQKMKTICKDKKEIFDELCTILHDYIGIFEDEYEEEYQNSFE